MAHIKSSISINLLPEDFLTDEIKKAKFYKIQSIGVGVVLIMIFLASLTVALRILQSSNISRIQLKVEEAEARVIAFKNKQASLVLLKNRLSAITQNFNQASKQSSIYNLLDKLIPAQVSVTSLSIDKSGNASFLALVPNVDTLDNLLATLSSKERNEDKISSVSIESLSRGRDGVFRIGLKLAVK